MTLTTYGTRIDIRDVASSDRHPLIFGTFRSLGDGETMELIDDHDPRALYYELRAEHPERLDWAYLQGGPQVWRVLITKLPKRSKGLCCGMCGGA